MSELPTIFSFFDYRSYLKEYFEVRKAREGAFNWRSFQDEAGIPGSGSLHRIVFGNRNLTQRTFEKLLPVLNLQKGEEEYFRALILFQNQKNPEKKEVALRKLLQIRSRNGRSGEDEKKLKYFQKWFYPVIRSLIPHFDFKEDYNALSRAIIPPIQAHQAKSAVKFLLEEGYVRQDENGRYHATEPVVSTPASVHSTILTAYHRKNSELNIEAFDKLAPEDRPFSSVTMELSKEGFDRVREELRMFRQKLLSISAEDQKPDRVCHVNFQILPRAKVGGNSE